MNTDHQSAQLRDRSRRIVSSTTRGIERATDLTGLACSTAGMLLLLTTPTLGILIPITIGVTGFVLSGIAFNARIRRRRAHLRHIIRTRTAPAHAAHATGTRARSAAAPVAQLATSVVRT